MRDSYNNLEIFQFTISIKFEYIVLKDDEENTFERASRKFSRRIKKTNGFLINCDRDALPRASN